MAYKDKDKALLKIQNLDDKSIPYITNEFLTKRKKLKIKNNSVKRRTLFLNKNKLLFEDKELNKENELTIKSNDVFSRKREFFHHSAKKKKRNINLIKINKEFFNDNFNKNILNFNPQIDRNKKIDISERGFMRKKDYDLNNLINNSNKNKEKRAITSKINNNRINKTINIMEYNLDRFINSRDFGANTINNFNGNISNNKKTINNNNTNHTDMNTLPNNISGSYLITDLNEEEIISKKNSKIKYENLNTISNTINDITHRIHFIDNKNNLISKDNIINLLNEEENLIIDKIKQSFNIKNFSKFIKNKDGKKILLPILYRNLMNKYNDLNKISEKNPFLTTVKKENEDNNFDMKSRPKTPKNNLDLIDYFINNNYTDNSLIKNFLKKNQDKLNELNRLNLLKKYKLEKNKDEIDKLLLNKNNINHDEINNLLLIINKSNLDEFKKIQKPKKNSLNNEEFKRLILLNKKKDKVIYNKKMKNYISYSDIYLSFNSPHSYINKKNTINIKDISSIENLKTEDKSPKKKIKGQTLHDFLKNNINKNIIKKDRSENNDKKRNNINNNIDSSDKNKKKIRDKLYFPIKKKKKAKTQKKQIPVKELEKIEEDTENKQNEDLLELRQTFNDLLIITNEPEDSKNDKKEKDNFLSNFFNKFDRKLNTNQISEYSSESEYESDSKNIEPINTYTEPKISLIEQIKNMLIEEKKKEYFI